MPHSPLTIKDLYPHLPPDKVQEMEEVFDRYLDFVLRAYERITADPRLYEHFLSLTGRAPEPTIKTKGRSFTSKYHGTEV